MPFIRQHVNCCLRESLEIEDCCFLCWNGKLHKTDMRSTQVSCALALLFEFICSWFKSVFADEPLSLRLGSL